MKGKNPTKIVIQANVRGTFHGGMEKLLELMGEEFPKLGLQRKECFEMKWAESFHFANLFRNGESLDVLLINFLSFKMKSDFVKKPIPDVVFEKMLEMLYEEDVGKALIFLFPYRGKMNEILESAIPFPHRAGNLYMIQTSCLGRKKKKMKSM
ncbi:hypothetical protein TIFTF001_024765 [Ficus carica]|uniref:Uncharacterized protein n=1 Tax=Ficus carica TaxID=3494 RepID=A0AA88AYA2_FICCA|nr:hypothetical protein TIFTF001_024765 [Ficus carica]